MYRQKGSRLVFGEDGLLQSGLLVRVLVLPNGVAGVADSLAWIAETLSPRVAISLMAQYYPIHRARPGEKYGALNRSITAAEWEEALAALEANGMDEGFQQELETAEQVLPSGLPRPGRRPFRDIRDFAVALARRRWIRPPRPSDRRFARASACRATTRHGARRVPHYAAQAGSRGIAWGPGISSPARFFCRCANVLARVDHGAA